MLPYPPLHPSPFILWACQHLAGFKVLELLHPQQNNLPCAPHAGKPLLLPWWPKVSAPPAVRKEAAPVKSNVRTKGTESLLTEVSFRNVAPALPPFCRSVCLRGAVWFQTISTSLPDIKRLASWLNSGSLCLYVSAPEGLQGGRAPPRPPSHPYASVKIMRQHDDPLQGKRDMTGGASSWSGLSLKAPCDFYF